MVERATYGLRDAALRAADALPAAAGTVNGTVIDLGNALTARGARLAECEFLLTVPAQTVTTLPDTVTATYSIQHSASNFSSTVLIASAIVQTGAGGAGAAANTYRFKIPSACMRYLRVSVITSTNAGNQAALSMTLELLF